MPRSTGTPQNRAAGRTKEALPTTERLAKAQSAPVGRAKRIETLVDLFDFCRAAQRIAEAHGEKLLAYLLAMAAQEGADAVNRQKAREAAAKPASPISK